MSLRWGEHQGRTKSTAEISFQSSFFWIGGLIVARPHLFIFFVFFFFWLNLKFFFFLRFENELQREQMMYKNRFLFLHFEPIGELISVWIAVDTDVLFGKSTFRLTWIYLFILFFCLNMFIKIQNFLFFEEVFGELICVVISALWNLYLKRFLIGLWMNQVVFDLFWTSYWLHT